MEYGRLIKPLAPYALMAFGGALVLLAGYFEYLSAFDTLMIFLGTVVGLASAYHLLHSFGQDRRMQFYEGEQVILTSSSTSTHAIITHVGDAEINLSPLRGTIYLTTLGIVVEPPDTGFVGMFIPLDQIQNFTRQNNGLLIRYYDLNRGITDSVLYVDNIQDWMLALTRLLSPPQP
jgi:hypothetical protein